MSLITALFRIIIGAWINNVFIWKIKNRIDALDDIYINVLEFNDSFLELCLENYNNPVISRESIKK